MHHYQQIKYLSSCDDVANLSLIYLEYIFLYCIAGQMALFIEGMGGSQNISSLEKYIIGPDDEIVGNKLVSNEDIVKLYKLDGDCYCIAYPIKAQSTNENTIGFSTTHGTLNLDTIVDLIGNVHKRFPKVSTTLCAKN